MTGLITLTHYYYTYKARKAHTKETLGGCAGQLLIEPKSLSLVLLLIRFKHK